MDEDYCKPFLKWAGGKTQLLVQLRGYYPPELQSGHIRKYVEPFLGGGAVFLDVARQFDIKSAFLSDINPELVLVYRAVQESPNDLIDWLDRHVRTFVPLNDERRKQYFYATRDAYNHQRSQVDFGHFSDAWVKRAADMIFLNKTCFNGLYRVNSKGEFNVPFGRYVKPLVYDGENLLRMSRLLGVAEIVRCEFTDCERAVDAATFVYFDPPYRPISATAHFTSYSKHRFDDGEQIRLAGFFAYLHKKHGPRLMLSNSDPKNVDTNDEFFDDLYSSFRVHRVTANRMINANTQRRGKITELLVTNYP